MTKKRGGQVRELQDKLNDPDIDQKQEAIRRIIDAMTRGKDVSMLFMDVMKNMQTPSLQLKKLIYLYVMSYAKSHPDLAILGINTFRKDAVDKNNPFLRGLAVRTMGCIRIKQVTVYLCDPLKKALKDQDAYVRKTGALCVPKLYQIDSKLIEDEGFLKLLQNLLNDGNATVVSNAVVSLSICSEIKGQPLIKLTDTLVQKLLTAMNDCNEWGVVYILDALSGYIPKNPQQAEGIMQRVSSKLAHTNSAVALSSIRLILRYMDYLTHPESIRSYNNKISAPLITMISRESQISYLVLKTINLILQKRPLLLPKQLKIFFVNYQDPLYVKLEKLQVLAKIASNQNILLILHQLKDCVQQVDVQFVRRAVRTMGRCAIKLQKSADKCVQCLWETLKTKIPYVVQEAIIVIRDIFRKYPNKYEGLLADICQSLRSLDDPQAKASIIWIIGEYVEMIQNADQLLGNFADNFRDEPDVVQQQILLSCMKLYLHRPGDGTQILKDLFKYLTKQCQNPDLRDRGYLYWRLVSTDPKLAKQIVLSQRPLLTDQSYTLETELLEKLIENIGCLASIYGKQPQDFVKRLKDNANAKQYIQQDAQELLGKGQQDPTEQAEKPRENVNFMNNDEIPLEDNRPNMVQNVSQKPIDDLLNMNDGPSQSNQPQIKKKEQALLDLEGETENSNQKYSTTGGDLLSMNQTQNNTPSYATSYNQNQSSNIFEQQQSFQKQEQVYKNISIPFVQSLPAEQFSLHQNIKGLSVKAAIQRSGQQIFLDLILQNNTGGILKGFMGKLKPNAFRLQIASSQLDINQIDNGSTFEIKIPLNTENNQGQLQGWPYIIDCALKVIQDQVQDVFLLKVPCSMSVSMLPQASGLTIDEYRQITSDAQNFKKQQSLRNNLSLDDFIVRMQHNNLKMVFRKDGGDKQLMSFVCILTNQWRLATDIIFQKSTNEVNIQMTVPDENIAQYFHHALTMIINLE